jgi:glycosyltransferase involved in cell wall biosynthesis
MQILLLTQIVPFPPDSGPKVKTYHVLRYLAEHGHRVTLVSFVRKEEERHLENLKPYCAAIHAIPLRRSRLADVAAYAHSVLSGQPFLIVRDAKPAMQNLVCQLTRDQHFDIIHADQLTMVQYALPISNFRFPISKPALVFDAHNAVWTIVERAQQTAPFFLRPLLAREACALKKHEGALCNAMDATLAVSEADRCALVEAGADAHKISVIPIAVDSAQLQPVKGSSDSANILTISTLFYPPNADGVRWFINQVFPLVRLQMPEATLTIVGPRPPKDITQFAIRNSQFATVTGYVPDLTPYLERAALMVVPVRAASGMRVRILEALARGIPIVTTTTGVEGINAEPDEHLLIADAPEQFAAQVVRLLNDGALRQRLSINGRRLIEDKYDWRVVLPKLEAVYESFARR